MEIETYKKEYLLYLGDAKDIIQMPSDFVFILSMTMGQTPYELAHISKEAVEAFAMTPGKDPDTYEDHPDAELKKDTRVIKKNTLPGDQIRNGSFGFVKGSAKIAGDIIYMVTWDVFPELVNPIPPKYIERFAAAFN